MQKEGSRQKTQPRPRVALEGRQNFAVRARGEASPRQGPSAGAPFAIVVKGVGAFAGGE